MSGAIHVYVSLGFKDLVQIHEKSTWRPEKRRHLIYYRKIVTAVTSSVETNVYVVYIITGSSF